MSTLSIAERRALLAGVALFASFDDDELTAAAEAFEEVLIPKGDTVVRRGDAGGDFMVVASGELEVWAGDPPAVVARLGPGEPLGEIAALIGQGRTATVTAARRSRLLRLPADAFTRIIASNPAALGSLTRVLAQRLTSKMREGVARRRPGVITVAAAPGVRGGSMTAAAVAAIVGSITGRPSVVVRIEHGRGPGLSVTATDDLAARTQPGGGGSDLLTVTVGRTDGGAAEALERVVAALTERYHTVVIDPCVHPDLGVDALAEFSDAVVQVVSDPAAAAPACGAHTRAHLVVDRFNDAARAVPINAVEPFVLPLDIDLAGASRDEIVKHVLAHPRSRLARPLHRLARRLLGASVGVALGGGAALGIGHVGVLAALDEAGIPVDLVVGSSFGSIIAIGYAAGLEPAEMTEIARRIGTVRTTISALDVAVMKPGLLSGNRIERIFGPFLGSVRTFDDLEVPARCLAVDVRTGERLLIGEGELIRAVRASCSIPMLFVPATIDGRAVVDGAMIDPVPVDVAAELGADITIGVNVVPRVGHGEPTLLSRGVDLATRLNPIAHLNGTAGLPNAFDVIMNSINLLQRELSVYKARAGDITIEVDAGAITWHQFHRAIELIERGRAAAVAAIPEVKALLNARVAV